MARWNVNGTVMGGKYLGEYEADTAEQAVEMALEEKGGAINLCHQCNGECEDGSVETAVAELAE